MHSSTLSVFLSLLLFALLGTALQADSPSAPAQAVTKAPRKTSRLEESEYGRLFIAPKDISKTVHEYRCIPGSSEDCRGRDTPQPWTSKCKDERKKWYAKVSCDLTYNGTLYYGTSDYRFPYAYYLASEMERVSLKSAKNPTPFKKMDDNGLKTLSDCDAYLAFYNTNGHKDGPEEDEFNREKLGECMEIPKVYAGKKNGWLLSDGDSKRELANGIQSHDLAKSSYTDISVLATGYRAARVCMAFEDNKCEKRLKKNWRIPSKPKHAMKDRRNYKIPKNAKSLICF